MALGVLDALGNLDFLLARQQRHLPHLLEVHPDRVVEDVELGVGLFFFLFLGVLLAVLVTVDLRGVDDVDLDVAQEHDDGFEIVCIVRALGNRLIEIVTSEIALFFRELDQLTDARLKIDFAAYHGSGGGLIGRSSGCATSLARRRRMRFRVRGRFLCGAFLDPLRLCPRLGLLGRAFLLFQMPGQGCG